MTNEEAADLLDSLSSSNDWPAFPPPGIKNALERAVIALSRPWLYKLLSENSVFDNNDHRVDL